LREAAREKSQQRSHRGFYFAKARVLARPVRHRRGLDRFFREDVTGCIDAINANVLKRAAQVVAFNR
jgi:hypothetical protein